MQLKDMSLPELKKFERSVINEISKRRASAQKQILKELAARAKELGLDPSSILGTEKPAARRGRKAMRAKPPKPPAFANPNDPTMTWSGYGRRPKWVLLWQEQGRDLEELRIKR